MYKAYDVGDKVVYKNTIIKQLNVIRVVTH